jgi:hypothetical protein
VVHPVLSRLAFSKLPSKTGNPLTDDEIMRRNIGNGAT